MTIETRLAEIRARVEAATEGPWEWVARTTVDGDKWAVFQGESTSALAGNNDGWAPDAEFIAASRADVPWLLGQVELRDKALEAVMKLHRKTPVCEWCSFDRPSKQECHLGDDAHIELSNGEWGHVNIVEAWTCEECLHDTDDYIPDYPCPTITRIQEALHGIA